MLIKPIVAAAFALSLAALPAVAAEGNGNPFPNPVAVFPRIVTAMPFADTGSAAYPDVQGRAGSDLPALASNTLPTDGSEGIVQTANSLPAGAMEGTVVYAQAKSIRNWMLAHQAQPAPVYAEARRAPRSGS